MSCNICGKTTGPGALLCRPCKSALKRARQFTVLEMPGTPPTVTVTGLPLDVPRRPPPVRRSARPRWPPRAWARLAIAGVALGTLLGVAAYVAHTGEAGRGGFTMPRLGPAPRAAIAPDGMSNPERVSDFAPARGKDKSR